MSTQKQPFDPKAVPTPGTGEARPCPVEGLVEYEVEDDLVLYNPSRDVAHVLNPSAATIWWLCDGDKTHQAITTLLAQLYGLDQREVATDVEATLAEFRQAGVVKPT